MRFVFSRWGSPGDVIPYTVVARHLAQRGHQVIFLGNEHYAGLLADSAVRFVPVGTTDDYVRLQTDGDVFDRRRKSPEQIFEDHYYSHLEDFFQFTAAECRRDGGAVVVGGEVGSATAAERTGAPYVHMACSPATSPFLRSRYDPLRPERVLPPVLRWLARDGRRLAVMYALNNLRRRRAPASGPAAIPADHPLGRLRAREGMSLTPALVPQLALGLWPDWFASSQPDWPAYAMTTEFPFPSAPAVAPRTAASVPNRHVVVTTGSIAGSQSRFYAMVLDACALLKTPTVVVTPHRDQLPDCLPANIEWRAFAPFDELFADASLVIHHGGVGTAALAIAAGVPQIAVPMRGDQFDNGYRLERLGVARLLAMRGMTAPVLARIMSSMMRSRRVRAHCRDFQRRVGADAGAVSAADAIEKRMAALSDDQSVVNGGDAGRFARELNGPVALGRRVHRT